MTDDNTALADAQGSPGDPALPGGSSAAVPAPRPGGDAPPAPASPSSGFRVRNRLARLASRTGPDRPMLEPLLGTLKGDRAEQAVVVRAFDVAEAAHADQRRKSGDPYITHPLAVATILAELGMPSPVIVAALLHDVVEDTDWTLEQIRAEFGDEVASLVDGVTKLDKVTFGEAAQAETVRKMLTAMAKDVRVLVIKLADRLHNMRTLRYLRREKQERIARDTLEIFAPLAHRLGMNTLKWELEDLSFSTLYPKRYDEIVRLVAELAPSRDQYLADVREQLNAELKAAKIKATVTGRPKHYYSIYQKMIVKGRDLTDIYDLVGIRVLVESERDCYAALGQIHARWQPVPGRFKDFIAMPKFNLYQSLHTTVIGPGGKPVEVQIRTYDMHRRAEYGVAAHWRYKQNPLATGTPGSRPARPDENVETDLNWIPQLMEWQAETADPAEFLDRLRFDLGAREVYVFTPRGDVIALPQGATPVDFAYAVHTEVGHRCYGARVNGRLVSLESRLENGDTVDVLTTKQAGGPSRDWLQFVVSARARTKIRQWFTRERREEAIEEGRQAIARAMRGQKVPLQRLLTHDALTVLARDLRFADISALYAAVGDHRVSAQHVVERLVSAYGGEEGVAEDAAEAAIPTSDKPRAIRSDSGVVVRGSDGALMGDVLAKLARCCSPVPGDEVMGFVTRGSGVSVHRTDCVNARSLLAQKDRVLDVEWAPTKDSVFPITVQVLALDRPRLLADVTSVLSDLHLDIVSATVTTSRNRVAMSRFTFETSDPKHLGQVLRSLQAVDGVYDAHRVIGSAGTVDPAT